MAVRALKPDEEVVTQQATPDSESAPEPASAPNVRALADDEEVIPSKGAVERFGRGANVGIAEAFPLFAAVDIVAESMRAVGIPVGDEPVLGSRFVQRAFSDLGIAPPPGEEDPDTLAGSIGRMSGIGASMLLPVGAVSGGAAKVATGAAAPASSVTGKIVQSVTGSALRSPGTFVAAEGAAAASAGAGGFIARKEFPGSPGAQALGEIVLGLTPAAAITGVKLLPSILGLRLARTMVKPFTTSGGQRRAKARLESAARDPAQARAEFEGADVLPEAGLTPAQRTGDPGLLSLERSVMESSEQLKGQADEQIANANRVIRESLEGMGGGVPLERTTEALEAARANLTGLLDTRMRIAARLAEERIEAIGPTVTREQVNTIAREELDKALSAAVKQERELWNAVPSDVRVPTANSTSAWSELVAATPKAQQGDLPAIARRLLNPKSEDFLGTENSVRELQGLRSKLLETARQARAAGKFNKARLADELAEAVLTDLGATRNQVEGEAGEALRLALDFSADKAERFRKGAVGKLLGTDKTGTASVDPRLTLERTVGKGGPAAAVEVQALSNAMERSGNLPAMQDAMQDFLRDEFRRKVIQNGQISPGAAKSFMSKFEDALSLFPNLQRQFNEAIQSGNAAVVASRRAESVGKGLSNPKVSRAAVFIEGPVDTAMARVAKAKDPAKVMRELVRQARRDPTGAALEGLKTGFGEYLIKQASLGTTDAAGEFVISGQRLQKLLSEGPTRRMAAQLLKPDELKRLRTIANTAARIEARVAASPKPEGIVADAPGVISSTLARIIGAQFGRVIASKTGGGTVQTPGFVGGLFKRLLDRGVQDPARRLIVDAIQDPKLFRALTTEGGGDVFKQREEVRRQLNAWAIGVLGDEEASVPVD